MDDIRTNDEILSFQKAQISKLVDEVWNFFKIAKEHIHIPIFEINNDDQAGENNFAA